MARVASGPGAEVPKAAEEAAPPPVSYPSVP